MLKGELVQFGRFEWWSEKENANIKNHKGANNNGISFRDILPIFDDPYSCGGFNTPTLASVLLIFMKYTT